VFEITVVWKRRAIRDRELIEAGETGCRGENRGRARRDIFAGRDLNRAQTVSREGIERYQGVSMSLSMGTLLFARQVYLFVIVRTGNESPEFRQHLF
jgi:hypothetical protein